jgi:membrane protease YdiL (CAAX protease family)
MTRFTRRDLIFLAACAAVTVACLIIIARYFGAAFPEASIDFRYDRESSRAVAESVLRAQQLDPVDMKHAVVFNADDEARIFLERSLGLEKATQIMQSDVRIWYWHHRWFRPLQEEEYTADIAPTGELLSFTRTIPEAMALPAVEEDAARQLGEAFLLRNRVRVDDLDLVSASERQLPNRLQRILTWESKSIHPAGASYRHTITVDGNAVSSYSQALRIPEEWLRSYRELRSKNLAAGNVDTIFLAITMVAAVAVFIGRLRRGDLSLRFLLVIGAITFVLVGGVSANSLPQALMSYDTTSSYPAFIVQIVVLTILQSVGTAMLLIVVCGAGEVLYRERLPQHLAIPRLWSRRALASKRVFLSLILGYTLVAFFIAYQVAFYLIAARFGAWSPADVPYDDILNTAIPWIAVLFAGFFPAFSEEFLSRAFSIPFFQRFLRSRFFAMVLAGFIWGFGHSTYPNQPFYIRGLEVGLAGVVLGYLMDRYGLLALLIWHYTVDAVYTSLLLFRSGNTYYVTSAAVASAVFAIPLVLSIVLFIRNRGFLPDEDLTNGAMPVTEHSPEVVKEQEVVLPPVRQVPRWKILVAVISLVIAAILLTRLGDSAQDVVDYRITKEQAKELAARHIQTRRQVLPEIVAAVPVSGFRYWDDESSREEGGAPGGFDDVAATHLLRSGVSAERLTAILRDEVQAATWSVRFFTPLAKTEYFVEVDPRTARVIGYHKYAEETAVGPRLERDKALTVARSAFATYGTNVEEYELRDALEFQQPNRRDWVFHFDGRKPLGPSATKRVTVRVMGTEVTQFAATVKLPEEIYRASSEENVFDIVLVLLRFAGIMGVLALVIAGLIVASRHGLPWRRAARITMFLAIIPVMSAVARYESNVFGYSTAVAWDTFTLNVVTNLVRTAGVQILLIFIAVAAMLAVYPYTLGLLSRSGRARLGRDAAVSALAVIGVIAAGRGLMDLFRGFVPSSRTFRGLEIPDAVGMPLPSLFEFADALFGAIVLAGAVTMYATAAMSWPRRSAAAITTIILIFLVSLNSNVDARALPLMLLSAALTAVTAWVVARYILNGNPLAWPLTAFVASLVQSGLLLAQNARGDLRFHAGIVFVAAVAALTWAAAPGPPAEAVEPREVLEG